MTTAVPIGGNVKAKAMFTVVLTRRDNDGEDAIVTVDNGGGGCCKCSAILAVLQMFAVWCSMFDVHCSMFNVRFLEKVFDTFPYDVVNRWLKIGQMTTAQ